MTPPNSASENAITWTINAAIECSMEPSEGKLCNAIS